MIEVVIVEHERGWGARIDEIQKFDTLAEAEAFVKDYNKGNNKPEVPSWYMTAEINMATLPQEPPQGVRDMLMGIFEV